MLIHRRHFLGQTLASAALLGCGSPSQARESTTTPSNSPSTVVTPTQLPTTTCQLTEPNIEGPFFRPNAPDITQPKGGHRASLLRNTPSGTPLQITGRVLALDCTPVAGALIEVWHADDTGAYDHEGFRFRGRFRTGEAGLYTLATIVPGHYRVGGGFRPAHVHVKVHVPGRAPLTTQLYFEGDPYNEGDPFIRPSLIMAMQPAEGGVRSSYDLVV